MNKKIVVIGGGNGTFVALQSIVKNIDDVELSAVVSVSDSGGSSGKLRQEFKTIPPSDIVRAVLGLSRHDFLREVFYKTRFKDAGKLSGHNLGNLFLVLGGQYANDIISALRALEQAVGAVGHVYPVSLELGDLCVELDNKEIVRGEAEIDRPSDRSKKIMRAWIDPEINIYDGAKKAIESADYIILGPGSLYTSIIPNLLVKGAKEAIMNSHAKLVYITGSAYESDGEAGPEVLSEFAKQLQSYLPRELDVLVYSSHECSEEEKKKLGEKCWVQMKIDRENINNIKSIFGFDFEKYGCGCDPQKLGPFIKHNILCE